MVMVTTQEILILIFMLKNKLSKENTKKHTSNNTCMFLSHHCGLLNWVKVFGDISIIIQKPSGFLSITSKF